MPDLLTAYSRHLDLLYSSVIADVLDKFGQRNSALPCEVRPLRPTWRLFGRARTLAMTAARAMPEKAYALELQCLDGLQPGDVLVAATQADRSSALWGEHGLPTSFEVMPFCRAGLRLTALIGDNRLGRRHKGSASPGIGVDPVM